MTPDERLDKLTERVDALTQSVELLASFHRDSERRYERLAVRMDAMEQRIDAGIQIAQQTLDFLQRTLPPIALALEKLAEIANDHEGRLKRLETRG